MAEGYEHVDIHNYLKDADGGNAALMAALAGGGGGFGGNNAIWPLFLLAVLGRGRGGFFGGEGGDCNPVVTPLIQQKLGDIQAAIPLSACQTEAVITQRIADLSLGTQQAFSQVKDSVMNNGTVNLLATKDGTQSVLTAICDLGKDLTAQITQSRIEALQAEVSELKTSAVARGVEVSVTQQVEQRQAQGQVQAQLANLQAVILPMLSEIQAVRQGQTIFNSGTMAASGTQAAANTKVN